MKANRAMAACGLICSTCAIHLAPNDPKIAQSLTEDFKGMWENVKPEDFNCKGCWCDDEEMWSPDCDIRKCCIKENKLDYCYECQNFPCDKLENWANQNESYMEALNKLKEMKKNT